MKEFKQFQISAAMQKEFNVERLMRVAHIYRSGDRWSNPIRNHAPAEYLFSYLNFLKDGDEYILTRNGYDREAKKLIQIPVKRMVRSENGVDWVVYNNPDKSKAKTKTLLVVGGDDDLYSAEMRLSVEKKGDVWIIHNTSVFNGKPWQEAEFNHELRMMSAGWYIRGIQGGTYRQGGFIPEYAPVNSNTGGVRPDFIKLTINPDIPSTIDYKGVSDLDTVSADYCIKEADLEDPDNERLVLTMYHGTKQTVRNFAVSLKQIMNVK